MFEFENFRGRHGPGFFAPFALRRCAPGTFSAIDDSVTPSSLFRKFIISMVRAAARPQQLPDSLLLSAFIRAHSR
jgi:hypothetical protein